MPKRYATKRKFYPRRSGIKRRRKYNPRPQRAIGMRPGTYKFKRSIVYEIDIKNNLGMPGSIACADGKGIVWDWVTSLDSLPNFAEFTNLFEQYKLTGAAMKFYPAWNDTDSSGAANILMRTKVQRDGQGLTTTSTELEWLEMAATKSRVMPTSAARPIRQYMPLNQLNKLYSGVTSGTEDYSIVKPKFVATSEPSTPHYGMQFRFDTMGGPIAGLPGNSGKFKLEVCVYFQCRSVK